MRLITLALFAVLFSSTAAYADRDNRRGGGRDHGRRTVVRDNRNFNRPVVRDNRSFDRRGHQGGVVRDNRRGDFRGDRRAVHRRSLYQSNGRFTFHNGQSVSYRRPVISQRHYDVRVRPQRFVENYPSQYGYIWVNGDWSWNGYEWAWTSGYYAPDPNISTYYDDGSYE